MQTRICVYMHDRCSMKKRWRSPSFHFRKQKTTQVCADDCQSTVWMKNIRKNNNQKIEMHCCRTVWLTTDAQFVHHILFQLNSFFPVTHFVLLPVSVCIWPKMSSHGESFEWNAKRKRHFSLNYYRNPGGCVPMLISGNNYPFPWFLEQKVPSLITEFRGEGKGISEPLTPISLQVTKISNSCPRFTNRSEHFYDALHSHTQGLVWAWPDIALTHPYHRVKEWDSLLSLERKLPSLHKRET